MGSNLTLLIGHRGVGKSTYLKRYLAEYSKVMRGYDLDAEIALRRHESVAEILRRSEREFRETERAVLQELMIESRGESTMIALGAGFEGPLPSGAHVLWLRRSTDAQGRVFSNRPRLDKSVPPLQEYLERFLIREQRFQDWADEELSLPEGADFVPSKNMNLSSDLTLLPENFRNWDYFWSKRQTWGLRRLEIRDDLLSPAQIARALVDIPKEQILYTCRKGLGKPPRDLIFDWPLELGAAPDDATVISLHESDSFHLALQKLKREKAPILKLAAMVRTFEDLKLGHDWWLEDPNHRAFLPRSGGGRWRWYRSLFGPRMPIHFVREGFGSGLDQPLLYQAALQPKFNDYFGAVIGQPVEHSRSPMEHLHSTPYPFVAIDIHEDEFDEALPILQSLGLKFAAVTAPHKASAGRLAREANPLNTLFHNGTEWLGHNTDILALEQLVADLPPHKTTWIWGRGGMLDSLKSVWPEAVAISARAGEAEGDGDSIEPQAPDLLIWATGRSRPFQWPKIKPKFILDLNYSEDSPGLEFAVGHGIPYQSGLKIFKLQAAAQRQYWKAKL